LAEAPQPTGDEPRSRRFRRRVRLLPLLAIAGVAVWFFRGAPRDLTLVWDLGPRREGLKALRVDVLRLPDRSIARHAEHFWTPERPAPPRVRERVRLAPGEYLADVFLDYGTRTERAERSFELDRQEELRLQL